MPRKRKRITYTKAEREGIAIAELEGYTGRGSIFRRKPRGSSFSKKSIGNAIRPSNREIDEQLNRLWDDILSGKINV